VRFGGRFKERRDHTGQVFISFTNMGANKSNFAHTISFTTYFSGFGSDRILTDFGFKSGYTVLRIRIEKWTYSYQKLK
jgi:carbohydrate-selective porin OprB